MPVTKHRERPRNEQTPSEPNEPKELQQRGRPTVEKPPKVKQPRGRPIHYDTCK